MRPTGHLWVLLMAARSERQSGPRWEFVSVRQLVRALAEKTVEGLGLQLVSAWVPWSGDGLAEQMALQWDSPLAHELALE